MIDFIIPMLQLVFAIAACVLAYYIPDRIKWEQIYYNLFVEYRSHSFGMAIKSLSDFFVDDCNRDMAQIPREYLKRYEDDFRKLQCGDIELERILHFQRRMLTQYFYHLDLCAKSPRIGEKRVQTDFTKNEAHILKILYYMNKAVEESSSLFKDISSDERMPPSERVKGMNNYITHLYELLRKQPRYVR